MVAAAGDYRHAEQSVQQAKVVRPSAPLGGPHNEQAPSSRSYPLPPVQDSLESSGQQDGIDRRGAGAIRHPAFRYSPRLA